LSWKVKISQEAADWTEYNGRYALAIASADERCLENLLLTLYSRNSIILVK